MQAAIARCARCSQVSRTWSTCLVSEPQHQRMVGTHAFSNDKKRYSSSKSNDPPCKATPTDHERFHTRRQQSAPTKAHASGPLKAESKPKPRAVPEYARPNAPTVQLPTKIRANVPPKPKPKAAPEHVRPNAPTVQVPTKTRANAPPKPELKPNLNPKAAPEHTRSNTPTAQVLTKARANVPRKPEPKPKVAPEYTRSNIPTAKVLTKARANVPRKPEPKPKAAPEYTRSNTPTAQVLTKARANVPPKREPKLKAAPEYTRSNTPTAQILTKAHANVPPKPESKLQPKAALEYIRSSTPTVQDTRFDFDQPNPRKKPRGPIPQMEAKTFGMDTAEGLSEALQSKKLGTDPQALFGILAGWVLRHEARNMGYGVSPDGFVRMSDMLRFSPFSSYSVAELARLAENDEKDRFEVARLPDFVEGVMQDVWWIRARHMHSIPGVNANFKRVLRPEKLQLVEYRTQPKNWDFIRANGIPEDSLHLIHLYNPAGKHLFLEHIPFHEKVLSITVDCQKAMQLGVMFYRTPEVDLYAVGTRDKGVIPLEACRSAVILDVSKEALK